MVLFGDTNRFKSWLKGQKVNDSVSNYNFLNSLNKKIEHSSSLILQIEKSIS